MNQKTLYNGQWLEKNTYQVVVGYGIAQKFSMGLLDFNNQLEVPNLEKELLKMQNKHLIKVTLSHRYICH
jgi:hypothetical protein